MRDWIVGLQKAAIEHRAGVTADEWIAALSESNAEAPDELRDFYQQLNGATFASGVVLFPLRGTGEVKGALEQSRTGGGGLPTSEVWRIGRKDTEHLAAIRKRRLTEIDQADGSAPPDWLESAADEAWVFVARDEASNGLRVYPTLEMLLTTRIPPADSEEFGERTFARALSLVEDALEGIGATAKVGAEKVVAAVKAVAKKRKAKAAAAKRKPAVVKASAAPKRASSGAKKSTGGKKTAARKSAANRPAAKAKSPAAKAKSAPAKKKKAPARAKKAASARKKRTR